MEDKLKIFSLIFCFIVVLFGIEQLSYKNTIFADTLAACCENKVCNGLTCNHLSSIEIYGNNCRDVNYSCKDCIDFIREGMDCKLSSNIYEYCILPDGNRYSTLYGEEFPPPSISIDGPASLQYGAYGTFTASVTDGTSPFHYQWYYLYQNPSYSPNLNGIKPNVRQYGIWYTLGADSPTLTTTFVMDAELKCVVADDRNDSATSNILYIHIIMNKISVNLSVNHQIEKETVNNYTLMQNYPNPFNPSTTIKYSIVEPSHVILSVYDILGKKVTQLVNNNEAPGIHEVEFKAKNLPSGIYFYRITAGNYYETKKMFLSK